MHKLLQKTIHTAKKNKSGVPKEKVKTLTDKYVSILDTASEEYEKHPPTKNYMDGYQSNFLHHSFLFVQLNEKDIRPIYHSQIHSQTKH